MTRRFELTQLEDMLIDKKSYGLFVIDRAEAAYGIASGKKNSRSGISCLQHYG